MRAAGQRYMPIWPAEDNESYKSRLGQAVLFPAYSRTVETLASKPFSQPMTLGEDVPPVIVEWAEDIDLGLLMGEGEQKQKDQRQRDARSRDKGPQGNRPQGNRPDNRPKR